LRRIPLAAGGALAAALLASMPARAGGDDGVYGRFDGDIELRAHAGVAFAGGGPMLAARLSVIYLSTAGIYTHYTDALGSAGPLVSRSFSAGVHFAPIFLARYASDGERGPGHLNLLVDSLAFQLGAFWSQPQQGAWDDHPGLEVALDLSLPILPNATGPFVGLRGALRWRPGDFVAGAPGSAVDRGAVLSLTFGWHQVLRAHIVDTGDGALP
jgi:hypothetical protein